MLTPWKKSYDKSRQHIKQQRHHFASNIPYSQSYGFSSSYVQMWELDHEEGSMSRNWCFWIVVPRKTLESSLDCKEIKPVDFLKEINPEYSLKRLMMKFKVEFFDHLMWSVYSLEKTQMLGKIEGRINRGQLRMRWLDHITNSMDMSLSKL